MNALAIVSDSGTLPEESSFYLSIGHKSVQNGCTGIGSRVGLLYSLEIKI